MSEKFSLDNFVLVLIALCFLFGLGYYALENINEGLYAEIPREMLLRKDYIIPHLNFVPYLEKPPLLYWLTAISYHLFGLSEFSARLVPALSATATVLIVRQFMRRIQLPAQGALASLMLCSSVIFVLLSRIIIFDMLLTALITGALCSFYLWYEEDASKYLQWSYGCVALAVMAKGLIALVVAPLAAFGFMLIQSTPRDKWLRFFNLPGIVLFLLITLPWHIFAVLSLPDFAYQYFVNEHWLRFLDLRVPNDYHTGPWYFYLPRVLIYLLPWTLFLPYIARPSGKNKALISLCWLWFAIPMVFYSLSKAKGDYYMVLGMVPLVIILACKLYEYIDEPDYRYPLWLFYGLLTSLIGFVGLLCLASTTPSVAAWLPAKLVLEPFIVTPALWLLAGLVSLGVISVVALRVAWFKLPVVYALFASMMVPAAMFLVVDKSRFESKHSEKAIAQAILRLDDSLPVFLYKDFEDLSSINFYLKKRVGLIDSRSSDLYYGSHTPAARGWFVDLATIQARKDPIFVVMKPKYASVFSPQFCVAHREGSSILMTNQTAFCQ